MDSTASEPQAKPTKYYIDFENVHGAGLKGVDALTEHDEVVIIYSQAAETFHIEHAIDILKSKAHIQFVEADAGTRNAADFQLIVALYANMDEAFDYVIVSGDGGFDAAIKMGERMGKPRVRRLGNIMGDEAEPEKPKSRRSRRSRSNRDASKDSASATEPSKAETAAVEATPAETPQGEASESPAETPDAPASETSVTPKAPEAKRSRRSRAKRASTRKETDDAYARAAEAMRLASESAQAAAAKSADDADSATASQPETDKTPAPTDPATSPDSAESNNMDTSGIIKAFLIEKGLELSDAQIATVASALHASDGRQSFYRHIIKIERQQNGRALYHQVREHYGALKEAVGQ